MARRQFFQASQKAVQALDARGQQAADAVREPAQVSRIDESKPLITAKQAQLQLGLASVFAVYRLKDHHGLPFRRLGRAVMFHPDEIDLWTKRHRERDPQRASGRVDLELVVSR